MAPSCSSSRNWLYDVFVSFRGEDVRRTFLSHLHLALDRKLITSFKDNEIERSHSIGPELTHAIRGSRIAIVVFSKHYASSAWCLNELLEISKCREDFGQMIVPIFYDLDPSHVSKQSGDFGKTFEDTCKNRTGGEKQLWRQALTDVAKTAGYHSENWASEAQMIDDITNDVLAKLNLGSPKDFSDFVGLEDHITRMSSLLALESEEVKIVGIWGTSGIGKTTIARALYNRLCRHFQGTLFIDRAFISTVIENYKGANPDDYNMKLGLQRKFLYEILGKNDIKIDHLGAVEERLRHMKVLLFIDDLDDQVVLDVLAGQAHWFGSGSRIIVITGDKHLLRAHGINIIYKVDLPSRKLALEIFCQSAFGQTSPAKGFDELAFRVAMHAGGLPLGLNVLGSYMRGREKGYWLDILPRLQKGLYGKIEKPLRVSYDGLGREDKSIFRHIACIFSHMEVSYIQMLLKHSDLDVNIGIQNLVDKSLVHLRGETVEMHYLLRKLGVEIVRSQSNEPGEREFLMDTEDICSLLGDNIGTKATLGIALKTDEIDKVHVHESAFIGMHNLLFLSMYQSMQCKMDKILTWRLPEDFNYLPPKLRLLNWYKYPLRCMPQKFCPENLVRLTMRESKLEKMWESVQSLTRLEAMDLSGSYKLKEVPDLSKATNLNTLNLGYCSNLVKLPSSIGNLNKLTHLNIGGCKNLKAIPTCLNLQSLVDLNLSYCSSLKALPTCLNLQSLVDLNLSYCSSLAMLPYSIQNLSELKLLNMRGCTNLKTLPVGINLKSLCDLNLRECSKLKIFPDISSNISSLCLDETSIEEFPSRLRLENLVRLSMRRIKSEKLWDGVQSLPCLKSLDFSDSKNLKEIPDLTMATNIDILNLNDCWSLVELPSCVQNLNKLTKLRMRRCKNLTTLPTGINLKSVLDLDLCGCSQLRAFPDISTNISTLCLDDTSVEELPSNLHLENLVDLSMQVQKSEKIWEGLQPSLSIAPNVKKLCFYGNRRLVELPASIQYLYKLEELDMSFCKNLETLASGINLQSLNVFNLRGCSRLKSFPDVSTNISSLCLQETAIEEVPWWIEKFSKLKYLNMEQCNKLKYVSLNIYKLRLLERASFSDCKALTEASWRDCPSAVGMEVGIVHSNSPVPKEGTPFLVNDSVPESTLIFANCINLNQETLIQQGSSFNLILLPAEEVPTYFTHRAIRAPSRYFFPKVISLTNSPLLQTSLSQPFFRFRACVVVCPSFAFHTVYIKVCCRFRGRFGNHFDSTNQTRRFSIPNKARHLVIFDGCFPLEPDNAPLPHLSYEQVDIEFQVTDGKFSFSLGGCGIRLPGDCTPYLDNQYILPHVREAHETNGDNLGRHETDHSVECGDNTDTDFGSETDYGVECRDSIVEKRRSSKRRWVQKMHGRFKKLLTCYGANPLDKEEMSP